MHRLQRHSAGYPVVLTNPTTRECTQGKILGDVWAKEPEEFSEFTPENNGWIEAAFLAQLIDWKQRCKYSMIFYSV